jgi:hypothetical protein
MNVAFPVCIATKQGVEGLENLVGTRNRSLDLERGFVGILNGCVIHQRGIWVKDLSTSDALFAFV